MTPRDFIYWLKGFAQAANVHNVTPKQWQDLVEVLDTVELEEKTPVENRSIPASGTIPVSSMTGSVTYGTPSVYVTYTGTTTAQSTNSTGAITKQLLKTEPNN